VGQIKPVDTTDFPDLWGLTANEVANRKSTARLSLQEYHIDQNIAADSEVRTIESVAFYPLHLLLNNQSPFNYSLQEDHETPKSFIPIFTNAIKLYQLYIFFVYAISELGSVHAEKILEVQSKHIEKWMDSKQAYALAARFDDLSIAAREHTKRHLSNLEYDSLDIPIEQSIAKIFLLQNKESPFYINTDTCNTEPEVNFRGMDLALADHLGMAKDCALEIYAHYFNVVIVEV
jgi:hypothetical protein